MMRLDPSLQQDLRDAADDDMVCSMTSLVGSRSQEMDEATAMETYDEMLSEVIEGRDDHYRGMMAGILANHEVLDRITAELIVGALCDPVAVLAIAVTLDDRAIIQDGATDESVLGIDPHRPSTSEDAGTWVELAPGIDWWSTGQITVDLPETTLLAAVGRPLRDVLTHPVLDRHPLSVTGLRHWDDGTRLLVVDSDRTPLTTAQLLELRPNQ